MAQANGNNPQVEAVETALRKMTPPVPTAAEANVMSLLTVLAERCRNIADTMVTTADDDRKEAYDFSNHLLDLTRRWGNGLLKRKRSELAELERFLGQLGQPQ